MTTIFPGPSGMASAADTGSVVFTHISIARDEEMPLPTRRPLGPGMSLAVTPRDTETMAAACASYATWPRPFVISTHRSQSAILIGMQLHQIKDALPPFPIRGDFAWCMQVVRIEEPNQAQAILEGLYRILDGWARTVLFKVLCLGTPKDVTETQLALDKVQHTHISFSNANCHSRIMPLRITETAIPINEASQPVTEALFHGVIITLNHHANKGGWQA